jgi:hypothetical protein
MLLKKKIFSIIGFTKFFFLVFVDYYLIIILLIIVFVRRREMTIGIFAENHECPHIWEITAFDVRNFGPNKYNKCNVYYIYVIYVLILIIIYYYLV